MKFCDQWLVSLILFKIIIKFSPHPCKSEEKPFIYLTNSIQEHQQKKLAFQIQGTVVSKFQSQKA